MIFLTPWNNYSVMINDNRMKTDRSKLRWTHFYCGFTSLFRKKNKMKWLLTLFIARILCTKNTINWFNRACLTWLAIVNILFYIDDPLTTLVITSSVGKLSLSVTTPDKHFLRFFQMCPIISCSKLIKLTLKED